MWLINAADRKTIVQVAAYFNPMRLTDRVATPKGLEDITEAEPTPGDKKGKKGFEKRSEAGQAEREGSKNTGAALDEAARKISPAAGGKSAEAQKEQAIFDNPGELLEKLAEEVKGRQPTTASSPVDGTLKDPFDRLNRKGVKASTALRAAAQVPPADKTAQGDKSSSRAPADADDTHQRAASGLAKADAGKHTAPAENKVEEATKQAALPAAVGKDEKLQDRDAEAKSLETKISGAIAQVSKQLPNVEVKATPEGLLVSLTDDANFGMFEVGSAKPRPELVVAMDKIGEVLKGLTGKIVVRGHTDSRRYKSGIYDNWRLSAARAQMAYYMLIRGGIAESSVVAIEGRADRDPKVPSDTEAAQNRRIDILIKEDKP
jgi:chemotaxis protein MotB